MNLAAQLAHALPAARLALLRQAAALADDQHKPIWLVGGPVRDLILGRSITDLDLVIEGDAMLVGAVFADATSGKLTTHAPFGTATVTLDDNFSIDFVTARSETYTQPAALPVVTPAPIADDLRRRDFTINTLALSLTPATWGDVVDVCDGVPDIEAHLIRVLHDRSFIDDPTRILRAVRFAGRLNYQIESHTLALMQAATSYIAQTSPARILHELYLLGREPEPERALLWLEQVGALPHLLVTWESSWGVGALRAVRTTNVGDVDPAHVLLGLLAPGDVRWTTYYPLTSTEQRLFKQVQAAQQRMSRLDQRALDDGTLDQLLQPFDAATLWVVLLSPPARDHPQVVARIQHYLNNLRHTKTFLNGDDLRRLGIPPGPRYRQLLSELRVAQLRGAVADRAQADTWVRQQIAQS